MKKETIDLKDPSFQVYTILFEIVLTIYYRISQRPTESSRETMYDEWLLDIPKLLDLVSIYGDSNPEIVKAIINNVYKDEKYDGDTLDFFSLI